MNSFLAYFLGLFTVVLIIFIFWVLGNLNTEIAQVYRETICSGLA